MSQTKQAVYYLVSEIAFYFFLYYAEYLLEVKGNLWLSALLLWLLMNLAILFCPVINKRCDK